MKVSHTDGCKIALVVLSEYGAMPAWRHVGLFTDENGQKHRCGVSGEADVQGTLPYDGRSVGVEVKTGRAKLAANQRDWKVRFEQCGGLYILAIWNDELDGRATIEAALEAAGYVKLHP